ncbi:MAG: TonB-dependent receptor [Mucinivorans sp.]
MLRFLYRIILSLTLLVCAVAPLRAQRQDTIQSVVVVGQRIKKEIIPVQVLMGDGLRRLSVHSVADAVRYFAGVQIKDYGGIGGLKTVNIRSMGSHHVGVFYDGVELGNAQNGVIDLGRFSLDNMEAISLYNGQKSAIFQPAKDYASASAIYMVTRRPSFPARKANNWNFGFKGGSFATINPSVLWEHKINDKITTSFSSEFLYTSGKYKFSYAKKNGYDTTEVRQNGDVNMFRAEAAIFGQIQDGQWMAKAYYYNSQRGYPGASVRQEPGKFTHQDRQWDDNFFAQGTFRKLFGSWYSLLVNGKYSYDYLHYLSDPNLDVSTMYVDNHYRQQESYVSAAHLFSIFDWWSASLSTDFQWNTLDADLVDFVYPNRYSLLTAVASSIDLDRFKLQVSLLHTLVNDKTRTVGANAGQKSVFTPSIVASWKPFKQSDFNIRAFYKRVFRMPTLNDLYYTFIGNKDLQPEYTTQYDVGMTYAKNFGSKWFRSLEVQLDGYYNQVDNKIIAMPTSNQFRWTMLNLGYVEILGVDVAVQGSFKFGNVELSPRLSYTFQKAQDFTDPASQWYGGQIPYVPWHSGSVILGGSYKTWSWNYSYIYTGERYEAVANIKENYAQPWYTHDLSLSKTFLLKNMEIRATAEVNNIFNQQYEVVQCYPMPGTNFKIKINIIL